MEQMIEQPQPPEGDEATTGTMSPLAAVCQYLSTNTAKSTFLCNSGLVVKVTSSKSPTEQNLPARQSDISVLQTQVQSLMDVVLETRIVVDKCRQDMNGFETRLSDIRFVVQEQRRKKVEIVLLHQILQPKTLARRSNDLCFYTSDGAFIWKDYRLYANRPFVVWLEFILL